MVIRKIELQVPEIREIRKTQVSDFLLNEGPLRLWVKFFIQIGCYTPEHFNYNIIRTFDAFQYYKNWLTSVVILQ